jgi:gluconolactonase
MTLATASIILAVSAAQLTTGPVELISEDYTFSEGPVWLPEGRWVFSDVPRDAIFGVDGTIFRQPSRRANGLALDPRGRLIACESGEHRITRTETDGTTTVLADSYDGRPLNTTNDVVVRSDGVIFFTDPEAIGQKEGTGTGFPGVYAILNDGSLRLLADDMRYPNGIGLSPDEKTLYVTDFSGGHIRAFDLSPEATVSRPRVYCEIRNPDGMAVDAAGRVWTSTVRGISVFSAEGEFVENIDFEGMPTNCAFGGPDGRTLLITARKRIYRVQCKEPGLLHNGVAKGVAN